MRAGYIRSTLRPLEEHEFIYARSYMLTLSRLNPLVPATMADPTEEKVSW